MKELLKEIIKQVINTNLQDENGFNLIEGIYKKWDAFYITENCSPQIKISYKLYLLYSSL